MHPLRLGTLDDPWPFPPIEFTLAPKATALLVIDMQYHDAHPDYGVGRAMEIARPGFSRYFFEQLEQTVIPNVRRLLATWRQARLRVVFVTLGAEYDDLSDLSRTARERSRRRKDATGIATLYARSDFEFGILPELAPEPQELIVNKTTLGAFNSSVLDLTLRNLGIESLVVTGVVTSVCVETTARDAVDRGFATVIVDDACAAWDEESQMATLRSFRRYFGRVETADGVIAEITNGLRQEAQGGGRESSHA